MDTLDACGPVSHKLLFHFLFFFVE